MPSTKASNDRVAWQYTDTDGNKWTISAKSAYVSVGDDVGKYGGALADKSEIGPIPGNFRPRKAMYVDVATGAVRRYVVCYTPTAAAYATPGTTLTLNYRGVDTAFIKGKRTLGERVNRAGAVSTVVG